MTVDCWLVDVAVEYVIPMIAINNRPLEEAAFPDSPLFEVGQLVQHVRYGYRGVIVSRDLTCQADANWYWKNNTQPNRYQPWYHVLVDGSSTCTYAAETSLAADSGTEPILHPLVKLFFANFVAGRYVRNDREWPV